MKNRTYICLAAGSLLLLSLGLQAQVTRTSTPGTAIPDNTCTGGDGAGGLTDTIAFTEVSASISDVNVRVGATHTWRADLQFHVTYSGGGGSVILASGHDFSDDGYFATFDDEAAAACGTGTGTSGCSTGGSCSTAAAPGPTCQPDSALSAFDGLASPGTWTLHICDDVAGDTGSLLSWAVTAAGQLGDGLPVELTSFGIE